MKNLLGFLVWICLPVVVVAFPGCGADELDDPYIMTVNGPIDRDSMGTTREIFLTDGGAHERGDGAGGDAGEFA